MWRRALIIFLLVVSALAAVWLVLRRDDIPYDTLEARYQDEASRFLTLNDGLVVRYKDEGPRDAPVIVLIHGFSSSLGTWDAWAADLRADYRVVRFDLPGHGLTRVGPETELTTSGLVAFVEQMARALELEDFVLAGSSMGGHTAWRYALAHEDRLEGLVLVAAAGLPEGERQDGAPIIFDVIRNPVIRPIVRDLDVSMLVRDGLESSFVDTAFVTDDMVKRYADYTRAPGHRDALIALATRSREEAARYESMLKEINVPTLILHGDTDRLVPVGFAERYDTGIPESERVIYQDVGHLPQEEVAEQSLADLRDFLSGLWQAPTTTVPDDMAVTGAAPAGID